MVLSERRRAAVAARFERLRAMKAAGLIDKLPGRPPGLKRMKEEAMQAIAKAEAGEVAIVGPSGIGEELGQLVGESIKVMREVVKRKRPYKGDQHKLKVLQVETAGKALNAQLRADENVLRARQAGGKLAPVLNALLTAAGEIEAKEKPDESGFSAVEDKPA